MALTKNQRHAVTKRMAIAYKRGTNSESTAIPDSQVELTAWHRDHAHHTRKGAGTFKLVEPRRPLHIALHYTPLDFRRMFLADAIMDGLLTHIA